jgi:cell wall assembly regulator SMI1
VASEVAGQSSSTWAAGQGSPLERAMQRCAGGVLVQPEWIPLHRSSTGNARNSKVREILLYNGTLDPHSIKSLV